ncbi:MAG: hypothetical protein ACLQHS_16130, partial [Candidatus Limnocylindrales bacterium]
MVSFAILVALAVLSIVLTAIARIVGTRVAARRHRRLVEAAETAAAEQAARRRLAALFGVPDLAADEVTGGTTPALPATMPAATAPSVATQSVALTSAPKAAPGLAPNQPATSAAANPLREAVVRLTLVRDTSALVLVAGLAVLLVISLPSGVHTHAAPPSGAVEAVVVAASAPPSFPPGGPSGSPAVDSIPPLPSMAVAALPSMTPDGAQAVYPAASRQPWHEWVLPPSGATASLATPAPEPSPASNTGSSPSPFPWPTSTPTQAPSPAPGPTPTQAPVPTRGPTPT